MMAAQQEMIFYEPAAARLHAEVSTTMLRDPDVKAQYQQLLDCAGLKRSGDFQDW